MKLTKSIFTAVLLCIFSAAVAQESKTVPAVDIKKLNGTTFNTKNIENDGKPIIISFWATW